MTADAPRLARPIHAALDWALGARRASHGLAVLRIALGGMTVVLLAMYLPQFSYSFGRGAAWGEALFRASAVSDFWAPLTRIFSRADSDGVLLAKMLALMLLAAAYALGWHWRVVSPLFVLAWLSFSALDPIVTNTGHFQTFRLFLLFMLFADASHRWSLDARRRARRASPVARANRAAHEHRSRAHGPALAAPRADAARADRGTSGESRVTRAVPEWIAVLSNNVAVVLIGYQLCVIYVTSALWKLQGATWASGVAAYYPLRVEELTLVPWLNFAAWQVTPAVFVASWLSVYGQLLFPALLLTRWTRAAGLVLVTGMHLGIAVLLALPWFSLLMVAGDAIFIRERTWGWIGARARQICARRATKKTMVEA